MGRIGSEVRISCQMFALKVLLLSMGVTPRDSLGEISGGNVFRGFITWNCVSRFYVVAGLCHSLSREIC